VILRLAAVVVVALALAGSAAAACANPRTSLGYLEGQVMCPTCHTTLDQSDSAAALRIEVEIRKRIAQCWTADQIKAELVANFGPGILAAPPRKGFDLLAWWLPLGGVIVGAAVLAFGVWRWSRTRADSGDGDGGGGGSQLDAADEQRLDELLARLD
jgi:cytochrome c-type biogenesis protein CcmH